MRAVRNDIDSEVLEAPVYELRDFDAAADFPAFERQLGGGPDLYYLGCKVPVDDVGAIHTLEANGFRFLEVQFRSTFKLRKRFETSSYPYEYSVVEPADVDDVMTITESTFVHDRFSADPALPAGAGGSRYRRFVEKSIERDDEFALKLRNPSSGEIVGFHTYAHSGGKDARFFIAGVKAEYKMLGLGTVLNYFALNEMYDRGIRKITTHQSASNFAILNLEIGFFDFRIVRGFAVLRKLYGDAPSRND